MKKLKTFKRPSIKRRLIITLCAVLFPALIVSYGITFISARSAVQEVFDVHLVKSAKLLFGLIRHEVNKKEKLNFLADFNFAIQRRSFDSNEDKIHFQAWKNDKMIYSSDNTISPVPNYQGFRDVIINGTKWHSFSFYDVDSKIRILVSERKVIRDYLIFDILSALFIPLLVSLFPLLLIIITLINRSINPLHRLAFKMKKMSATALEPFVTQDIPVEFKPFVDSFNSLLNRLRDALESERHFTDYAAHELKTPLAAIRIQAQLLSQNQDKTKEKEYLTDLLAGIERATRMVNQLLTLARIQPESKSKISDKEKFNFPELLESVISSFSTKLLKKNLSVQSSGLINEKFMIVANKTHIEIMLNNLIDNAIKYSHESTEINVEITKEKSFLKLKISNHGEVILAEEITKIFDNFYRLDKGSITRQVSGSGLGLAIAKKICQLHGGTIVFSSTKNGLNSVTATIPVSKNK